MVIILNNNLLRCLMTFSFMLFMILTIHAQRISASHDCVLYICEDSTISAIGNNAQGQLGDSTYINRYIPVKVKGLKNITAVNANGSLALRADGTVWQWSTNKGGYHLHQININNVIAISSGIQEDSGKFYCALKNDSSLWVWGDREAIDSASWGYTNQLQPMNLPKVKKVEGGADCVIAMCTDSSVWTWGEIESNGYNITFPNPQMWNPQKVDSLSKIMDIAAGGGLATVWALKNDGTVWEWGSPNGIIYYKPTFMNISNIKAIYNGDNQYSNSTTCLYAVEKNGSLIIINSSWNNEQTDSIYTIKNISQVTGSLSWQNATNFLLCGNDSIWRWGNNSYGQLGNFTTNSIETPQLLNFPCVTVDCDSIIKNPYVLKLDTFVYPNSQINLYASPGTSYWWSPNPGILCDTCPGNQVRINASDTERYTVYIADIYGCQLMEQFLLHKLCDSSSYDNPATLLDTLTLPNVPITLKATTDSGYIWQPSSGLSCLNCQNPTAIDSQSVTYIVTAYDSFNCPIKEKFIIRIRDCDTIINNKDTIVLDTLIIPGSVIRLTASPAYSYQWTPASGLSCTSCQSPNARIYQNTLYTATLTGAYQCQWNEYFKVTNLCDSSTIRNPVLELDTVAYPGLQITLKAPSAMSYLWQPATELNCTNCQDPVATVTDSIVYIVSITDSFGCVSKEKFEIRIRNCDTIEVNNKIIKLDTIIVGPTQITLNASLSYDGYKWSPITCLSCSNCQNPYLTAYNS